MEPTRPQVGKAVDLLKENLRVCLSKTCVGTADLGRSGGAKLRRNHPITNHYSYTGPIAESTMCRNPCNCL